jgi:preprotein translocase subunit SecE
MDNKKQHEEETRKLTFVVIFMSIFVAVLFGLGPLI